MCLYKYNESYKFKLSTSTFSYCSTVILICILFKKIPDGSIFISLYTVHNNL